MFRIIKKETLEFQIPDNITHISIEGVEFEKNVFVERVLQLVIQESGKDLSNVQIEVQKKRMKDMESPWRSISRRLAKIVDDIRSARFDDVDDRIETIMDNIEELGTAQMTAYAASRLNEIINEYKKLGGAAKERIQRYLINAKEHENAA